MSSVKVLSLPLVIIKTKTVQLKCKNIQVSSQGSRLTNSPYCFHIVTWYSFFSSLCFPDTLSKEKFYLQQNVEPFIHYKEKQATFECITRENIEAVAAKVFCTP